MSTIYVVTPTPEGAELVAAAAAGDPESTPPVAPTTVAHVDVPADGVAEIARRLAASPDAGVVIVGPDLADEDAIAIARDLDHLRPEIAIVLWAEPTAALLMQAITVGIRAVLPPNPSLDELRTGLAQAIQAHDEATTATAEPAEATARVVTVSSPKGGTGKTTVASNLAIALAADGNRTVALIDLDLQFGDVEYALRLRPDNTMSDAVRLGAALDPTSVKGCLTPHPSGVFALCAPSNPVDAESLDPDAVANVVKLLARSFDYVILDTASGIDDHVLNAMDLADDLVLLASTDVPTVRSAQKSIDLLRLLGHDQRRWHFVLNRADAKVGLGPEDVETATGVAIDVRIPESRSMVAAMNHGSPVVESQPKSAPSKSLLQLARRLLPEEPSARRRRFDRVGVV